MEPETLELLSEVACPTCYVICPTDEDLKTHQEETHG